VSMTSVVFPEFTLVCVKEECKEWTIYLLVSLKTENDFAPSVFFY
jgi:hypothetical protein